MFSMLITAAILLGLVVLGVYLLKTFSDGPTFADERRGEIEAAVKGERKDFDDIVITVTPGWCVFVRDAKGRPMETWVDDRPYQTPPQVAARALDELGVRVRAPPAPAPAATSWSTSESPRLS